MFNNRCTNFTTVAMHDVEHARRQASIGTDLSEQKRRHRSKLAWLSNHRITSSECRSDLPREQVERQVPRRDTTNHTKRRACDVVHHMLIGLIRLGVRMQDLGGKECHVIDRTRNVDTLGKGKGLPLIIRFGERQIIEMRGDSTRDGHEDFRASFRCQRRPCRERLARSCYGEFDVGSCASCNG